MIRRGRPHLLATLAMLVMGGTHAPGQVPHLDESLRSTFEALKSGDFAAFTAPFPTTSELQSMIDLRVAKSSEAEQAKARARLTKSGGAEGIRAQAIEAMRERFARVRAEAGKAFDWKRANFFRALPFSRPASPEPGAGWVSSSVEFLVWAEDSLWLFRGRDALGGPRGWGFFESLAFEGKYGLLPQQKDSELETRLMETERKLDEATREAVDHHRQLNESREQSHRIETDLARARDEIRVWRAQADAERKVVGTEMAARAEKFERALKDHQQRLEEHESKLFAAETARDQSQQEVRHLQQELSEHQKLAKSTIADLTLERDGLGLAVKRLETSGSYDGSKTAELPAWAAPVPDEPSWRRDLRRDLATPLTVACDGRPAQKVIAFIRSASGADVALLPDFFEAYSQRTLSLEVRSEPAAKVLDRLVAGTEPALVLELFDGAAWIGSPKELAALRKPLVASAQEAPRSKDLLDTLAKHRLPLIADNRSLADTVHFVRVVARVNLWASPAVRDAHFEHELRWEIPTPAALGTLLRLFEQATDATIEIVEGVLVFRATPVSDPVADLDPAVRKALPTDRRSVQLDGEATLADCLRSLGALYGAKLTIAAEVSELVEEPVGPLLLNDVSLAAPLRLLQHQFRFTAAFKFTGTAIVLTPIK